MLSPFKHACVTLRRQVNSSCRVQRESRHRDVAIYCIVKDEASSKQTAFAPIRWCH